MKSLLCEPPAKMPASPGLTLAKRANVPIKGLVYPSIYLCRIICKQNSLNAGERSFVMPDNTDPSSIGELQSGSGHAEYQGAKVILIVEDDEDIGFFLVEAIRQETPYHPIWVKDGFAALKTVHNLKPDLFILDYQLPYMDGIELYDQLRAKQELAEVPAIFMTANIGMPRHALEKRKIVGLSKGFVLTSV